MPAGAASCGAVPRRPWSLRLPPCAAAQHAPARLPRARPPPLQWWQVIIVNVSRQASKGCGDLIFSSHLTFLLTFTWTYAVLGHSLLLKGLWFLYTCATALCIIASRKQ